MTKQEHEYAQVLRWIADGEKVQMRAKGYEQFINASPSRVLYEIADASAVEFRLAPRTIRVNGVEVPAPEMVEPIAGVFVYVADPTSNNHQFSIKWARCEQTSEYLRRGLVYLTKEDAIARAKAMLLTQE